MSTSARLRLFQHAFAGHRRIVATVRVDLTRVQLLHTGDFALHRCEWDGSKERQPSVELYPEFRLWFDGVMAYVVGQTGRSMLYVHEPPGEPRTAEMWLYSYGKAPRLIKTLHKPSDKPLTEEFFGLEGNWEEEPCP